ncbi:MAG: CoA-binding protein [Actinobacteria bacterium]|nr:CoA-binding protein [Actinomycetota bacterium]
MPPVISARRLASLLRPQSVALVGATDRSGFSAAVYRNLVESGFQGRVHLVNRRGAPAHGRATVSSCTEIAGPVDLAFMMVPQAAVLDALTDAAAAGIRNAVILSSGFAEAGEAGRKAQEALVERAEALGVLLLGPNNLGFADLVHQIPVTAIPGLPRVAGPVAVLSQSGMAASAMLDFARMAGVGLSHVVTLGNEAMVTAGHFMDYLAGDEHTAALALYLESVRHPGLFAAAARRAARAGKAVVALKAGSSPVSARAAAAHSGAETGDDRAVSALFQELGVIRVDCIEDLILTAAAAAHLGRLRRPGIGVVSISGGACEMIADHAAAVGAPLPGLARQTQAVLAGIIPSYAAALNPLDVTGAVVIEPGIFTRSIEAMSADPSVGVVAVVSSGLPWQPGSGWTGQPLADAVGAGAQAARVPVVYVPQAVQPVTAATRQVMAQAGIPWLIPGLRHAAVALRNVGWWSERSRSLAG